MSDKSVNLGRLQSNFETTAKALKAAERALKRAQDNRDAAKAAHEAANTALRDGSRTVLG